MTFSPDTPLKQILEHRYQHTHREPIDWVFCRLATGGFYQIVIGSKQEVECKETPGGLYIRKLESTLTFQELQKRVLGVGYFLEPFTNQKRALIRGTWRAATVEEQIQGLL